VNHISAASAKPDESMLFSLGITAILIGLAKMSRCEMHFRSPIVDLDLSKFPGILEFVSVYLGLTVFLLQRKISAAIFKNVLVWDYVMRSGKLARRSVRLSILAHLHFAPPLLHLIEYFPKSEGAASRYNAVQILVTLVGRLLIIVCSMAFIYSFFKILYFAVKLSEIGVFVSITCALVALAFFVLGIAEVRERSALLRAGATSST
jgi:hypothetical protein